MREKVNRAIAILGVLSAFLIATALFGLPFPFVRAVWIREIWGLTGLIHAFLFLLILSRIGKASIPAPLAGIGIILNYEILTVLGIAYVASHRGLRFSDFLFFFATVLLGFFLIWILWGVLTSLCHLRHKKTTKTLALHDDHFGKNYYETDSSALIISAVAYIAVFVMLYVALSLDEVPQYAGLKTLGVLISPLSFGGIGQEIDYYLQGKQSRFFCIIKSLTHVLALACILWVIYRCISIASVVV